MVVLFFSITAWPAGFSVVGPPPEQMAAPTPHATQNPQAILSPGVVITSGPQVPAVSPGLVQPVSAVNNPVVPSADPSKDGAQADLEELARVRAQQDLAYQSMNAMNPVSGSFDVSKLKEMMLGSQALPPKMQALLSNPFVRFSITLVSDPEFTKSGQELMEHPNRNLVLSIQFGLFLFFVLFRWIRGMKIQGFWKKIWLNVWTWALFWIASFWGVPQYYFGSAYSNTVKAVVRTISTEWNAKRQVASSPNPQVSGK